MKKPILTDEILSDELKEYREAISSGKIHEGSFDRPPVYTCLDEILNQYQYHYQNLLTTLKECKDEVLLISLGSAPSPRVTSEQQLPVYIEKISKRRSVTVLSIDMNFLQKPFYVGEYKSYVEYFEERFSEDLTKKTDEELTYTSKKGLNLTVKLFACVLPVLETSRIGGYFYAQMKKAFIRILKNNGQVFIANHTQVFSFSSIPLMAKLYNDLKLALPQSLRSNLQLYSQCGKAKVIFYLEKLYDERPEALSFFKKNGKCWESGNAYYVCDSISSLCELSDFVAKKSPSALIQKSLLISIQSSTTTQETKLKPTLSDSHNSLQELIIVNI